MYVSEALLYIMNAISMVTIVAVVVALKVKPKPKTSTTHIPSYMTCEELRPAICVTHA